MDNMGLFNKVLFSAFFLQQHVSALATTNTKTPKEKRERQPNWTEAEKLHLISLTNRYRSILENKGSDGITIKRKSEAWDNIAINMKAAGYHRSKERLKQQLGRIKSAEAKRAKDAQAKRIVNNSVCSEQITDYSENQECNNSNARHADLANLNVPTKSNPLQVNDNEIYIKIEKAVSIKEFDDSLVTCEQFQFNQATDHVTEELEKEVSSNETSLEQKSDEIISQPVDCRKLGPSLKRRKARTRKQTMRQLQLYRIAIERERLRALRVQRKRDKLLYRKDIQIQNLKMQILQNLNNQNRNNHINF